MTIYEKLKNLNIFIENEYFEAYVNLIQENLLTSKQKFKTQLHHIIPKCYFKYMNLKIDNNKDNLVNLYLSDHIKAHCYLCLCFKDNYLSYANYLAVNKLLGVPLDTVDDSTIEFIDKNNNLINLTYEYVKEYLSIYNPMKDLETKNKHDNIMRSKEVRNKISKSMSKSRLESDKTIHITKDKLMKRISTNELEHYLSEGWILGTRKGRMRIHKDGHENTIWPEDFPLYQSQGWVKGGLPGRITESQRKALNESHKDMWTEERRNKQSEILNNFYKNNPNYSTKSKHKVKLYKNDVTYIFNSIKECEIFIGLKEDYLGKGHLSKSFKLGYINLKSSIYYKWNIEKLIMKDGDNNEESTHSN